ncbi:hypothetical protein OHA40_33905 [Nocardia sp. NBC_00508]|uniref:hypothetical protein n=1 Tax=Nocardia sp. NBC_00508 TaxID=2975992 RepID=UPI002E80E050|nr:hypothetical protein [Nocardia sp. NBC_00508]WUD66481.1 hypothetical protein OHA40_33905 [Nocardia sp. NBC_00508]
MVSPARARYAALVAAAAAPVLAACSGTDYTPTESLSATSAAPASTPASPSYNVGIIGNEIDVMTSTANPVDLLHIYNRVAQTMRRRVDLPEGGYRVQINCYSLNSDKYGKRLANGHIDVGKDGAAPNGDLGGFYEVVPGADCP